MMKVRLIVAVILSVYVLTMPTLTSAQDCDAGFFPVEHALGETCVPEQPEKIFTLDMTLLELLLIVENPPVAFSGTLLDAYLRMHPELETDFDALRDSAIDVGYPPNAEAVLSAEPDLIIVPRDMFTETLYPQLAEIAPTVVYEPAPGQWQERLIFFGEVLGLEDLVAILLSDYDSRIDELHSLFGDGAGEIEVSLVRTFPNQIGLVLEGTSASALLREVGLSRPEAQSYDYDYVLSELDGRPELLISQEELILADGDIIFVFGDASALADSPLWNVLSAVQNESAFEVGYYWWGDSLLSAHDMLDDIVNYIADTEATFVNPFEDGIVSVNSLPPESE